MAAETSDVQLSTGVVEAFPARPGVETGAVDAWLRHALSARYDATLAEQLPIDMLALLSGPH